MNIIAFERHLTLHYLISASPRAQESRTAAFATYHLAGVKATDKMLDERCKRGIHRRVGGAFVANLTYIPIPSDLDIRARRNCKLIL